MMCDVFKRTTDNWYPSYSLKSGEHLVEVSFSDLEAGGWRVCVWGDDDCGLEKDFQSETVAWCCFLEVIGMEDVTRAALAKLGFSSA